MKKAAKSLILRLVLSGPFYKRKPRSDCSLRSPGMDPLIRIDSAGLGHH